MMRFVILFPNLRRIVVLTHRGIGGTRQVSSPTGTSTRRPMIEIRNRLDLYHHHELLTLHGNLYVAILPVKPQRILDCGTGTGIWALDIGEVFPSAEVIGVDLSPIQPEWYANT